MLCRDVETGRVFKTIIGKRADGLPVQMTFIKLNGVQQNVVNIGNWHAAYVDPLQEVEVIGTLSLSPNLPKV